MKECKHVWVQSEGENSVIFCDKCDKKTYEVENPFNLPKDRRKTDCIN